MHYDMCVVKSPIAGWVDLRPFRAWCCQILPTIFDDTMSYYETLCKVQKIMGDVILDLGLLSDDYDKFKKEVANQFEDLKNGTWIQGTIPYLEELLKQYIPVAIFFGLTDDGHFCAYIPDSWDSIQFGTTGVDTVAPMQPEYGHLVLSY